MMVGAGWQRRDRDAVREEWLRARAAACPPAVPSELEQKVLASAPPPWRIWRQDDWVCAVPPHDDAPVQGWTVLVSATEDTCAEVLAIVAETCFDTSVAFTCLCDRDRVAWGRSRYWTRENGGVFVRIYPPDLSTAVGVASRLRVRLEGLDGPYLLSGRRVPGSRVVFYAYEPVRASSACGSDGQGVLRWLTRDYHAVPFIRQPAFQLPPGVADAFPDAASDEGEEDEAPLLGDGRFRVLYALEFSNCGGVYVGADLRGGEPGRTVVLKERRAGTTLVPGGCEAREAAWAEWSALQRLAGSGVTPEPVALIDEWESRFVVQAKAEGVPLAWYPYMRGSQTLRMRSGRLVDQWAEVHAIMANVCAAVAACHEAGVALVHLDPWSFLVDTTGRVTLVDLKCAVVDPGDAADEASSASSGETERGHWKTRDLAALGRVLLHLIAPVARPWASAPVLRRALDRAMDEARLSREAGSVIRGLLGWDAAALELPEATEALRRAGQRTQERTTAERTRGALRTGKMGLGEWADWWERRILDAAEGDPGNVRRTLQVGHGDEVGLGHGAAGVAWMLDRLGRRPPRGLNEVLLADLGSLADGGRIGLWSGATGLAVGLLASERGAAAEALLQRLWRREDLFACRGLLHGAAGFGMALLEAHGRLGSPWFLECAQRIGAWMRATRTEADVGSTWLLPGETPSLGLGAGGAGVGLFLLALAQATSDTSLADLGLESLRYDLSFAQETELGALTFPEDVEGLRVPVALGPGMRAGTAGVLAVAARYYSALHPAWLEGYIERLALDLQRSRWTEPGLLEGAAGAGQSLLDAHAVTGEERYRQEAMRIAEILMEWLPVGDGAAEVFDAGRLGDLASGTCGVLWFARRLLGDAPTSWLPGDVAAPAPLRSARGGRYGA
jgi:hypothetical protein